MSRIGLVTLIAATCVFPSWSPAQAQTPNVTNDRHVCVLPRPNNNGRVMGHDSGWSYRPPDSAFTYHLFGDTFVDVNGNGLVDTFDFTTGTIAYSTESDASDCVDLTYKVGANGLATPAIPPGPAHGGPADECLTWPHSAVYANNATYVFFTSMRRSPCGDQTAPVSYETGLAKLTHPTAMTFDRVGVLWPSGSPHSYSGPIRIGGSVYTFSVAATPGTEKVYLARVAAGSIENPAQYRFWNGATFGTTWQDAPIWTGTGTWGGAFGGTPSVAFNQGLDRYLAVYTCLYGSGICGRLASTTGTEASALTGGWGSEFVIRVCAPGSYGNCAHGAQHPAYAETTGTGSRIYVTTSRHDGVFGTVATRPFYRYWNELRAYDLSSSSTLPGGAILGDAEREFSGTSGPPWSYQATATSGPFSYVGAPYYSWVGNDGFVFADGVFPGASENATRVRWFPDAGSVELSVEARLLENCGDGVTVSVERVRGGVATAIDSFTLAPGWTSPTRGALRTWTLDVEDDDGIAFRTASGATDACDQTVFLASYRYLPD